MGARGNGSGSEPQAFLKVQSMTKRITTYYVLFRFPVLRCLEIYGKRLHLNRAQFTSYRLTLILSEYQLMFPLKPRETARGVL